MTWVYFPGSVFSQEPAALTLQPSGPELEPLPMSNGTRTVKKTLSHESGRTNSMMLQSRMMFVPSMESRLLERWISFLVDSPVSHTQSPQKIDGGGADERNLWPECLRILRESRAKFFVGENVSGIITNGNIHYLGCPRVKGWRRILPRVFDVTHTGYGRFNKVIVKEKEAKT